MIETIMDRISKLVEQAAGGRSIDPQGSITLETIRRDIEMLGCGHAALVVKPKRGPGRPPKPR